MADTTHDDRLGIVRNLPSDFEPWGQRSRENDWGPDCSRGCRWFVGLVADLNRDWGVCSNPASPRSGLLTFEHQGCGDFEAREDPAGTPPWERDRKNRAIGVRAPA